MSEAFPRDKTRQANQQLPRSVVCNPWPFLYWRIAIRKNILLFPAYDTDSFRHIQFKPFN